MEKRGLSPYEHERALIKKGRMQAISQIKFAIDAEGDLWQQTYIQYKNKPTFTNTLELYSHTSQMVTLLRVYHNEFPNNNGVEISQEDFEKEQKKLKQKIKIYETTLKSESRNQGKDLAGMLK